LGDIQQRLLRFSLVAANCMFLLYSYSLIIRPIGGKSRCDYDQTPPIIITSSLRMLLTNW